MSQSVKLAQKIAIDKKKFLTVSVKMAQKIAIDKNNSSLMRENYERNERGNRHISYTYISVEK